MNALHRSPASMSMKLIFAAGLSVAALCTLGPARAQEKPPIKIGVLLPLTGGFASNGEETLTGMKIYFDSIGNKVAGRKIQLIVEDEQGRPDLGLNKARKLVEDDHVQMLTGFISSAVAIAVDDYVRTAKIPTILSGDAGANELTMPGPLANPYIVRTSQNGRTPAAAAADFAWKHGWKKVAVMASDYAGGFDTIGGFAQAFCRLGGKIVQEQYPPIKTNDYSSYLTNLDSHVDGLVTFLAGGGGLRFVKQYSELGLKGKLPLMDIYGQVVYEGNLPQLKDAALGIYSTLHYSPMIKTPENEAFIKEYQKRTHHLPSDNGPDGWVGAKAIADAAQAVQGDVEDKSKFIAALKKVHFNSPKGEISLDQFGQVIQTIYVRKTEKVDGEYVNMPVESYPHVDQFWPFNLKEFESYKYRYIDLKGSLTDCAKVLAKK